MRFFSGLTSLAILAATGVFALPTASPEVAEVADVVERSAAAVTSLSTAALNAIVPFANFAAAAYCNVSKWKCSKLNACIASIDWGCAVQVTAAAAIGSGGNFVATTG